MVSGLDSFLNIAIPIGAVVFFGVIMFRAFRKEIEEVTDWVKRQTGPETEKIDPMYGGTIIYAPQG